MQDDFELNPPGFFPDSPDFSDSHDADEPGRQWSRTPEESEVEASLFPLSDGVEALPLGEDGWSGADIEEAYLKALQAVEAFEWAQPAAEEPAGSRESRPDAPATPASGLSGETPPAPATGISGKASEEIANATSAPPTTNADTEPPSNAASTTSAAASSLDAEVASAPQARRQPDVTPRRIMEAVLFVGGQPLTTKRLASLIGDNADTSTVEHLVDELNREYAGQGRPYEIRLGEGGYRLTLRPEFEPIRNKVYGVGPREVKLSQDALEVLALVAYQQPITHQDVESCGKKNVGGLLRQLLRRELIAIVRDEESARREIKYITTPRFLSLFGLGSIDELPQADELALR